MRKKSSFYMKLSGAFFIISIIWMSILNCKVIDTGSMKDKVYTPSRRNTHFMLFPTTGWIQIEGHAVKGPIPMAFISMNKW